jgi:hypothetical protein
MSTINYYPMLRGRKMWYGQYFDLTQITKDFKLLHQTFSWDTIRIFAIISAFNALDVTGSFNIGGAGITAAQKSRFTSVCNTALTIGCRLHLTLFDGWAQYGAFDQGTAFIQQIASAIPIGRSPSEIFEVVEFQNETPWDSITTYTAGGANAVAGWTIQQAAVAAAQNLIPVIRSSFSGVPVTISGTHDPHNTIAYAMANLTGTSRPDWIEAHLYPPHDTLSNMQYVTNTWTRTARIGEFGWPTTGGGESTQNTYYDTYIANWATANPTGYPVSPWMAFDADAFQGLSADEAAYGLIGTDGHYKTAVLRYLRTPPPVNRFMIVSGLRYRKQAVILPGTPIDASVGALAISGTTSFGAPSITANTTGTITVTSITPTGTSAIASATVSGTGVSIGGTTGNSTITTISISSTAGVTVGGTTGNSTITTITLTTG